MDTRQTPETQLKFCMAPSMFLHWRSSSYIQGGHKNLRETTSELTGPETSHCQWSPPLEFILGEEMRLSTNTKTIRMQIQSWQWIFYITKC